MVNQLLTGRKLKAYLALSGMTQKEVCEKTKVSMSYISQFCNGRLTLNDRSVFKITSGLNLDLDSFKRGRIMEIKE